MKNLPVTISTLLLFACLGGGFVESLRADEPSISAELEAANAAALPAPAVVPVVSPVAPQAAPTAAKLAPAAPVMRTLDETEVIALLTAALQQDYIGQKGDLELRFNRSWAPISAPDEPLTVKILDLPNAGVGSAFIVRFEIRTAEKAIGNWQMPVRAQVWKEIWVARSPLVQGGLVADADIARERRDMLTQRSALAEFEAGDAKLELATPVPAGSPLLARSVRVRAVVHKGQMADAVIQDGALSVSLKVQVLEDGAPGDYVRARNPQSHRDITGRVVDDRTLMISL